MITRESSPVANFRAWLRLDKWLAPLLVIVILAAAAYRENKSHPIEFWNDGLMDYPGHSLAHALNVDFWLSESSFLNGRRINYGNTMHPGFPFQVSSWVGYRLSCLGTDSDARSRCGYTLADPSAFWLATRLIALATGLICSALCARAASSYGFLYAMSVGLSYFCYEGAWDYSIRLLGNETFALPLAVAVVSAAGRCLALGGGPSTLTWWSVWGAVCALCWLNKLNYIAWAAAAVPAWGVYFFVGRPSAWRMGTQIMAFVFGFMATAYLLARLLLGSGGLRKIFHLHRDVLTHSGHFGAGSSELVSYEAIWKALHSLTAFWPFLVLASAVCLLSVWILYSLIRSGKVATRDAALIGYLLSAASLFFAAVLKHYGPHYLVAGVPAISLLLLTIGQHLRPKARLVMSAAVGTVLIGSYYSYTSASELRYRHEVEVKRGLRSLDDLPRHADDAILWTYRLPERHFGMEYMQIYAQVPEVSDIIEKNFPSPDLVFYHWDRNVRVRLESIPFENAKWRYAVFDKDWYGENSPRAKEFFEYNCTRIVDESSILVFERKGQ